MATTMSTNFIQIALAGLAAFVAFTQVSDYPKAFSVRFWLFILTGVLFLLSMYFGGRAVSEMWKIGEGRIGQNKMPWLTQDVKGWLDGQPIFGILALLAFACLVMVRPETTPKGGLKIESAQRQSFSTPSGEIVVNGQWQNLSLVDKKTKSTLLLGPTPPGQSGSLTISTQYRSKKQLIKAADHRESLKRRRCK